MYLSIQKNIHCETCKECGARPVIEQLPKSKFRILCPNNPSHYKSTTGFIDGLIAQWNNYNNISSVLRKVG